MNSSQSNNNTPSSANSDPSSSPNLQDLNYFEFCNSLGPIETLTLESESEHFNTPPARDSLAGPQPPAMSTSSPREDHMQMEASFVESRGRIEISNVDGKNNTHSMKEDSKDPLLLLNQSNKMPSLEDCEHISHKNDVKGDHKTVEALLLEKTVCTEDGKLKDLTEVIDTTNKSSIFVSENAILDVSKLNPNKSLQLDKVSTCEGEDMIEMINKVKTRRKRRKSVHTSENKNEKRCNCKKSGCLKLYCECFANGVYCGKFCGCKDCINKSEFEDKVKSVSMQLVAKNALAFAPKVTRQSLDFPTTAMVEENLTTSSLHRHKKGCNCKKSMCQKKYCECFQAEVCCTSACCCENCRNTFGAKSALEHTTDERTKAQVANNLSSTHASNFIGAPTSNLTNPNGCPESPFGSFSSSISDPIDIASLQPCGNNMDCSYGPISSYSIPYEIMAQNGVASLGAPSLDLVHRNGNGCIEAPMAPFSSSNNGSLGFTRVMVPSMNSWLGSMSFVQQGSNLNPRLNLGGSPQFISQIIPTSTSHFTYVNPNDDSTHNGGDHKNFNGGQ